MSLNRTFIDLFAPKEVKDVLKWLDGKKTILGVVIVQIPIVIEAVNQVLSASGVNIETWTKIAGGILTAVGVIHKVLKG